METNCVSREQTGNAACDSSVQNKSKESGYINNVYVSLLNTQTTGGLEEKSVVEGTMKEVIVESKRILDRAYFCKLCDTSFTRAHSLARHNARKHPYLKEVEASQSGKVKKLKSNSHPYVCVPESPRKISGTIKESNNIQQSPGTKIRKLKIILSSKIPALKTVNSGKEKLASTEGNVGEKRFMSEEEQAIIQTMKESCERLQELGHQVLVVTADREHSQWFGSSYGVEFAQDNTEVIGSFFSYCKEKENASRKETQVEMKKENDTIEDLDIEPDGDSDDEFMDNEDEEREDADTKDDVDDDYDVEEDEAEENDNDDNDVDDESVDKNNYIPKAGRALQHFERKEKAFEELAEGFKANEISREVSDLLRMKIGVRPVVFTVADLNRGQYNCKTCGYNFLWKCHLELHQVKNPHCGRVTNFKRSEKDILKETISFANPQTGIEITSTFQELLDSQKVHPLSCAICGRSGFRDRFRLRDHIVQHNTADTFECNICCAGYSSMGFLSTHLKDHYRKSYECHRCHWRFTNLSKLNQHTEGGCATVSLINNKEAEGPFETIIYKCDDCSAEVTGVKSLRNHLTLKHDKQFGPFDCVLCDKKLSDTKYYNRHLLTHSQKASCPYCPKKFSEKSNSFYHHLKSHKTIIEFPYVCDICGEKFKSRRNFDPHRRIHTGERPYACEFEGCEKAFRSKDGLEQHKWCHKNHHYICDFCGRKFKKPSLLNNHRLSHTLDWRYPCIYCPQKFKKIRPFKRHLARLHPTKVEEVKEKFKIVLHPCNLCQKVFFDKEDHTSHMYRHKGIKPFSCSFCGKSFSDKSNMTNHEQAHKGGKKLKCLWCSRKFNEEKYLQSHIQRLHALKQDGPVVEESCTAAEEDEEDIDELRESTLQIIDETIRGNVSF